MRGYHDKLCSLRGHMLTADCRRSLADLELMILAWCRPRSMPVHILLTKSDKLSRGAGLNALQSWRRGLPPDDVHLSAQLFSALDKAGVEEAREKVLAWLNFGQKKRACILDKPK